MDIVIRPEAPADADRIRAIHTAAYETDAEAVLVDGLRREADPYLGLVAEVDGEVAAHIAFTPVTIGDTPAGPGTLGLAPLSVHPDHQDKGLGTRLAEAGLAAAAAAGCRVVVALGHPEYYARFGFGPAVEEGLSYEGPEYDPFFLVKELVPGALQNCSGEVFYHPLFDEL